MIQRAFLIHALSPLHAGTGQVLGLIDLPIARYKATGIPYLPGTSIKGVLRDALEPGNGEDKDKHRATFGPDVKENPAEHAGAVAFGDARLLLLPVRSLRGTFAYATSPLLLRLGLQDLDASLSVPRIPPNERRVLVGEGSALLERGHVFFEDIERIATISAEVAHWGAYLGEMLFPEETELLTQRLAIVDDETMTFFWETCTQVDARVRINERGVVQDGALWYEESLPPESVLVGLSCATKPFRRRKNGGGMEEMEQTARHLLDYCLGDTRADLQFGGKATVGRGRARLIPAQGVLR